MNGMGSNGWAIGKDPTENGRGMLLANPHYPWIGTSRFWEKHLVIPGKMNVYGARLVGVPGVANLMLSRPDDTLAFKVGATKIKGSRNLTDKGYPVVHGSSFVMSLSYTDEGPVADAILTYSQSGDPSSETFTDQTKMFAKKQWRPVVFTPEDISRDAKSSLILTEPVSAAKD